MIPSKVETLFREGGRVICLCGDSGAGKTTRAMLLKGNRYPNAVILDGDSVRYFVNSDLGFSDEDRRKNNEIIANIAKMLYFQGKTVIISTVRADIAYELLGDEVKEKSLVRLDAATHSRKNNIFNLTQHRATAEQLDDVVDPESEELRHEISALLTFDDPPSEEEMSRRAKELVKLVPPYLCSVMIGGAPFFVPVLAEELKNNGLHVYYAFSKRVSVDDQQPDGSVVKRSVFKHLTFV